MNISVLLSDVAAWPDLKIKTSQMCFMVIGVFPNLLPPSLILAFTAVSILMLLYDVSILYVFAHTCLNNFMLNFT